MVAAGHEKTAEAAAEILEAGGNAFDAAAAALCAACVAEPVLASLGGGGFLLACPADRRPLLYDFFVHTPRRKRPPQEVDFYPIVADFGEATQEFHIGRGSIATPGTIKGLFRIQADLCRLSLREILGPAQRYASQGIPINRFQRYIATIIEPILRTSPEAFAPHESMTGSGRLALEGETTRNPELADLLQALVDEGEDLFYRGELGRQLVRDSAEGGGYLQAGDLEGYRVRVRPPLAVGYRDSHVLTNPPPSFGGFLIAFALQLLEEVGLPACRRGGADHLAALATAMRLTQSLRACSALHETLGETDTAPLDPRLVARFQRIMRRHATCGRGTTQISVVDREGNLASLTLSNGEGSGYVLPGTGMMLNNMLGEEDINPHGFHGWPENRRIASMMAPSVVTLGNGTRIALGSGGSNRIRSAILQVISNLVDYGLPLAEAVAAPRIHFEGGLLNLEPPCDAEALDLLSRRCPRIKQWDALNLFFGGAHSVLRRPDGLLEGAGDPRRGGVICRI